MAPGERMTADALLAEADWLERLALRLVAEPHAARDAAHDVLVVALERRPAAAVPLRRWLAGVLRNLVRQGRRRDDRRARREAARGAHGDEEAAGELAARLELHQRLTQCVRELDEPYRSTVALRFLDDLSPAEIARRQGVPVKTVYTRLERALARLRARLDDDHGGSRAAWALVLVPRPSTTAAVAAALPSTLAPLAAMGTLHWTAAAVAAVALGFAGLHYLDGDEPRAASTAPELAAAAPAPAVPDLPSARDVRPVQQREAVEGTVARGGTAQLATEQAAAAPAAAGEPVRGIVLTLDEVPVAGAHVRYGAPFGSPGTLAADVAEAAATSDAEGRFELPGRPGTLAVLARAPGLATLLAPTVLGLGQSDPVRVWLAPERDYGGRVVDQHGEGVEGADVELRLPEALRARLDPGVFVSRLPARRTVSGANGEFRFDAVGYAEGTELTAAGDGHAGAALVLPDTSRDDLLVELRRYGAVTWSVAGVVRFPDGRPAAGARVALGEDNVLTDADGRFGMQAPEDGAPAKLLAIARGALPVSLELGDVDRSAWGRLELTLGAEALAIRGTVVDAAGEPLAGARVWTDDGEPFGHVLEELDGAYYSMRYDVEALVATEGGTFGGRRARSGADGRFALTGLIERDYALFAQHPRTMEISGPHVLAGGAGGVVLALAGAEETRRVAGRVTSYAGAPIEGARVLVERRRTLPDGRAWSAESDPADAVLTDAEGRFEFAALAVHGTTLLATRESPQSARVALAEESDLTAITVRLPARCEIRIELDDPARADSFDLRDRDGRPVTFMIQVGGMLMQTQGMQLSGGTSDRIHTDESAVELVLRRGTEVVQRVPLRLTGGELNVVRP